MPIRPTSRLDLFLVPAERSLAAVSLVRDQIRSWRAEGKIAADDGPGPRPLVDGGFLRVRVDEPGGPTLYANQVGGFHVRCPACGAGLGGAFRPFGATSCVCGRTFPVEALVCRPPVAVGWASLVIVDARSMQVDAPIGWTVIGCRPA